MEFCFTPMTAAYAQAIVDWHYEGSYTFYDMDQDPEDLAEFLDPQSWPDSYFAVLNEEKSLVGFFIFAQDEDVVEIGLGLAPDFTGRGLGQAFVEAGLAFARRQFYPQTFRLKVAQFNQRAICVYERAGFAPGKAYNQATNDGVYEFLCMERTA